MSDSPAGPQMREDAYISTAPPIFETGRHDSCGRGGRTRRESDILHVAAALPSLPDVPATLYPQWPPCCLYK